LKATDVEDKTKRNLSKLEIGALDFCAKFENDCAPFSKNDLIHNEVANGKKLRKNSTLQRNLHRFETCKYLLLSLSMAI
jgi:hypothetical protein